MNNAELRIIMAWLGLKQDDIAPIIEQSTRSVRRMLHNESKVPAILSDTLKAWINETDTVVSAVIAQIDSGELQALPVYSQTEQLHQMQPDYKQFPATWWDIVIARVKAKRPKVPVVPFEYTPSTYIPESC